MSADDARSEFEARLLALKHKMERGLVDRARNLRAMADRLDSGDQSARREIKTESHKLRGVAGSYGHDDLTDLAGELEQRASVSPPATVTALTRSLADLAESKGRSSMPPPQPAPATGAGTGVGTGSGIGTGTGSGVGTGTGVGTGARPAASAPSPARTSGAGVSRRPRAGKPLRVLAMDDDPVTQRLLQLTLAQVGGFDAVVVGAAAAALDLLQRETFDVVLSDAMMPDMNGRDFRRAARAAGAQMPIVILSAAGADELGWDDPGGPSLWLRKPFKPTTLVRDIERIVAEHGKPR